MAGWGMYYLLQKVCPLPWGKHCYNKNLYKTSIFYKIMPLSRNVNHDKMSAFHQGPAGIETVMWGRHCLPTIIERPIIGGGLILWLGSIDMMDSVGGQGTKTSQNSMFDSTRHLLIHLYESWINKQCHFSLVIKIMIVTMNLSILIYYF